MELKEYLLPLRRWWWLLVAATVVSTFSSYVATTLQTPLYQTKAALMIGQAIEDPNPNSFSIYLTEQLAQSYADIASRQTVRQGAMETLGMTWLPEYRVSIVPNTQILEVTVVDSDPVRAQAVANALAEQLVETSPTSTREENQQRQTFINEQLATLETTIEETEEEIQGLQDEVVNMISARQIADAQSQIATLENKLNTLRTNYATLLANTREGAINTLRVIEWAPLPTNPINSNRMTTILLGAAIGFSLAAGAAFLMEYLDDTLKTPEEISRELDLPVIGFIADTGADDEEEALVAADQPRSPIAEAFRSLRTNLEFASVDEPLRSILITSPSPSDGKTTVATNLAVMMAQGGKRVMLVDADMRRPRVHRYMKASNRFGLSNVFRDQLSLVEASQPWNQIEDVSVVTSGSLPPNPAELLGSAKMNQIIEEAEGFNDVVIIDSPPFVVSDSAILAAKVDGVVLVIRPGRTSRESVRAMMEQFQRADARMVGVVLNRVPRGGTYYGGYRHYYAPYYYSSHYYMEGEHPHGNGHRAGGGLSGLWKRIRSNVAGSVPE